MRPSPFYSMAALASWPIVKGLYRLRAEGLENLPEEGGFVLARELYAETLPGTMNFWTRGSSRRSSRSLPLPSTPRGAGTGPRSSWSI